MLIKPKFWYCTDEFKKIWNKYDVYFSTKFCSYFAQNVEKIMLTECNLKASNKVGLSLFKQDNGNPIYVVGTISKLNIAISILPYFTDDLEFCWKTKNGVIIKPSDEDFDEENLICWIKGLKPKLYWEQVYTKKSEHPFIIKNLPYELEVFEYGTLMSINIELIDLTNANSVVDGIMNLIEVYNKISNSKNRKNGIVHNSSYELNDKIINYRIDLGSAGINFLKKVLKQLSKYSTVKKVILDL